MTHMSVSIDFVLVPGTREESKTRDAGTSPCVILQVAFVGGRGQRGIYVLASVPILSGDKIQSS